MCKMVSAIRAQDRLREALLATMLLHIFVHGRCPCAKVPYVSVASLMLATISLEYQPQQPDPPCSS